MCGHVTAEVLENKPRTSHSQPGAVRRRVWSASLPAKGIPMTRNTAYALLWKTERRAFPVCGHPLHDTVSPQARVPWGCHLCQSSFLLNLRLEAGSCCASFRVFFYCPPCCSVAIKSLFARFGVVKSLGWCSAPVRRTWSRGLPDDGARFPRVCSCFRRCFPCGNMSPRRACERIPR